MKASGNVPSPCNRCGLRSAPYVLLKNGTAFRVCDLCYWGQVESVGQEQPERTVLIAHEAEAPLAAAA